MIVVTGGAGFIGSNLVAALEARGGEEIVVCDALGSEDKWRNIAKREITELIAPDQLLSWLSSNIASVHMIFHLGAVSSTVERDVDLIVQSNFRLSQALWDICVRRDVRLIYASSAAVYGDGGAGFDDQCTLAAMAELRPLNPYGWSKLLFDRKVARYADRMTRLPGQWAGLRFFNVYGPNEYHKGSQRSVVPQFWQQIKGTGQARLFKSEHPDYRDGAQARDFVHVDDCVSIMLWLYDNYGISGLFNVGTGQARSFADMANAIFAVQGVEPRIEYFAMPENARDQYQYFTQARIDRLREAGYDQPFTSLEDGVRAYVQDYLETSDPYR
jgi:ADP-L-glycero-D-manno-heptose 6-epimerase